MICHVMSCRTGEHGRRVWVGKFVAAQWLSVTHSARVRVCLHQARRTAPQWTCGRSPGVTKRPLVQSLLSSVQWSRQATSSSSASATARRRRSETNKCSISLPSGPSQPRRAAGAGPILTTERGVPDHTLASALREGRSPHACHCGAASRPVQYVYVPLAQPRRQQHLIMIIAPRVCEGRSRSSFDQNSHDAAVTAADARCWTLRPAFALRMRAAFALRSRALRSCRTATTSLSSIV